MKADLNSDRGVTSIEYSSLLALLCMVLIPVLAGNGSGVVGVGPGASEVFFTVGNAIANDSSGAALDSSRPVGPAGGSEGTNLHHKRTPNEKVPE